MARDYRPDLLWGGPILASFYFSFTEYGVTSAPKFVGLENYTRAFTEDDLFWTSLGRTFMFSIVFVPVAIGGGLLLAVLLNQKLKGSNH